MTQKTDPLKIWYIQNPTYEICTATKTSAYDLEVNPTITEETEVVEKAAHDKIVSELKAEIDRLNNKYDFQLLVKSNDRLKADLKILSGLQAKLLTYEGMTFSENLKIAKLKQLLLLTDPVVSHVEVSETQHRQWAEFINCFPEEG